MLTQHAISGYSKQQKRGQLHEQGEANSAASLPPTLFGAAKVLP